MKHITQAEKATLVASISQGEVAHVKSEKFKILINGT